MSTSRYRAFELLVESEVPLLGFAKTEDSGQPDVTIRIGSGELPPAPESGLPWTVSDSEVTLWVEGIGAYRAIGGKEIIVDPQENVPQSRVALALRSSMWAALMLQRGLVPLHGSCVESPQGSVIIMGQVGSGKSTLATALQYKGFKFVTDEMTVLRTSGGAVEVVPSYPEVRLWAEALDAFGIPEEAWGAPIRPPFLKFSVPIPEWHSQPVRPRAVFFLNQRRDPEIEVTQLNKAPSLARIYHFLYRSRFFAEMPGMSAIVREALNYLVQTASVFVLEFPSDLNLVPELCDKIIDQLTTTPERPAPHWSQNFRLPRFELTPEKPLPADHEGLRGLALLASYPKSGNTWMRALLTAWRRETEDETDLEELDGGSPLLLRHHLEEVLGVETDYMGPQEILDRRSDLHKVQAPLLAAPTLIKTHDVCSRGRDGELLFPAETLAGILYIVRNPLDVVLSAMNHFQLNMDDTVKMMGNKLAWGELRPGGISEVVPQFMGSWSGHVTSWLDETSYRLLVVRYEDLLADTLGELKKIIEFFEFTWDEERGRRAVEKTKFQRLQEKEKEKGFREKPIGTPSFFRQGKAGGWREALPPDLQRKIVEDHGEVMRRLGYEAEVDEVLAARVS